MVAVVPLLTLNPRVTTSSPFDGGVSSVSLAKWSEVSGSVGNISSVAAENFPSFFSLGRIVTSQDAKWCFYLASSGVGLAPLGQSGGSFVSFVYRHSVS